MVVDDVVVVVVELVLVVLTVGAQEHAELYLLVAVPQAAVARAGNPVVAVRIALV